MFIQPAALHPPQNQRMGLKVPVLYSWLVPLATTLTGGCFPKVTSLTKDTIQGLWEFCARNEDEDQVHTISQPAISGHYLFLCIWTSQIILVPGYVPEFLTLSFIKYSAKDYSIPGIEPDPWGHKLEGKKIMSLTPRIHLARKHIETDDKCSALSSSFKGPQLPQIPLFFTLTAPQTGSSFPNPNHVFAYNYPISITYLWAHHFLSTISLRGDLYSIIPKFLWNCQSLIAIIFPSNLFAFLLCAPSLSSLDPMDYFFKCQWIIS